MQSKEALQQLNNFISREKHINSERNKTINECINTIKQDLERLEALEKAYKKVVESIVHYEYTKQRLENEKLKKEKEQIKQWIINKIKYLDKGVFLMSGERVKGAIEILNELLKEVLGE